MKRLFQASGMLVLVCVLFLGATSSFAQAVPSSGDQSSSMVHRFARPGRATMKIYLWGQVAAPGIWRVEKDVDLIELLSAARLPGVGTEEPEYRQHTILTIFRGPANNRRQVYQKRLKELVAESGAYPDLQEGDVLQVKTERKRKFNLRTISQYIGTASSLVLLFLRLHIF